MASFPYATAAYGNDISVIRSLRDSYMLNNAMGTAFVDTNYRLSPPVADSVAGDAATRNIVRTLLLTVVIVGSFVLTMPGVCVLMLLAADGFVTLRVRRRESIAIRHDIPLDPRMSPELDKFYSRMSWGRRTRWNRHQRSNNGADANLLWK